MEQECAICQDFIGFHNICHLACGHEFHDLCLQRWLNTKRVCPMCRSTSVTCQHELQDQKGEYNPHRRAVLLMLLQSKSKTKEFLFIDEDDDEEGGDDQEEIRVHPAREFDLVAHMESEFASPIIQDNRILKACSEVMIRLATKRSMVLLFLMIMFISSFAILVMFYGLVRYHRKIAAIGTCGILATMLGLWAYCQ